MIDRFPGFLGYGGIIAIHADWPIYPTGLGWEIALKTLGNFPVGTNFYEIDDIDRCKLLLNKVPSAENDPFDDINFHISLWHEDLIELKQMGFIKGVEEKSDTEFKTIKFEELKNKLGSEEDDEGNIMIHFKDKAGVFHSSKYPRPKTEDEDEPLIYRGFAYIANSITLTSSGHRKIAELSHVIKLAEQVEELVNPLLKIDKYDTAIREASLLLESTMKKFHSSNKFGQQLVEFHIKDVVKQNDNFYSAAIKCYRGELRTIFKYIRNDFAHNFRIVSSEQCRLILSKISDVFTQFEEVKAVYYNTNETQ
jgi:hypothetical protein